jgi:hypothetical protein
MDRGETVRVFTGIGLSDVQARDLEIGIYNASLDYASDHGIPLTWKSDLFCEVYLGKARGMFRNLQDAAGALRRRLAEGEFLPHELPAFAPEQLKPEAWIEIVQKEILKEKGAYEPHLVPNSTQFFCRKCKKNKCSVVFVQLRSADEPMSALVTCLNCGHKFKC